jgi:hypothetical protein
MDFHSVPGPVKNFVAFKVFQFNRNGWKEQGVECHLSNATVHAGALKGSATVTAGATTLTSNQEFSVTPTISSFSLPSSPVGTPVTITGTGLAQTTKVTFNGKVATFTVNSDTQVQATVHTGAATGKIEVTTKGGTATSATSFTVS